MHPNQIKNVLRTFEPKKAKNLRWIHAGGAGVEEYLIPELDKFILPIDFSGTDKKTMKNNIKTAKEAKEHLINKGLLIIFPSGSVSVAKNLKTAAHDDEWKLFPAKLIHQTKTDVLPIYFEGKNGFLFHLFASKL